MFISAIAVFGHYSGNLRESQKRQVILFLQFLGEARNILQTQSKMVNNKQIEQPNKSPNNTKSITIKD